MPLFAEERRRERKEGEAGEAEKLFGNRRKSKKAFCEQFR